MQRLIDNDQLTMMARLAVGATYIYASFYKLVEPGLFAKTIWYYHLVPGSFINIMALVLPWLELICGLAIIFGFLYRGSVVLVNLMTLMFIFALATTIMRGIDIDCGCFKVGKQATRAAWDSLIFDLGLIIATLWLFFSRSRRWKLVRGS